MLAYIEKMFGKVLPRTWDTFVVFKGQRNVFHRLEWGVHVAPPTEGPGLLARCIVRRGVWMRRA